MDTVIDQPVNPPPAWELLERCGPPGRAASRCHGSSWCTWSQTTNWWFCLRAHSCCMKHVLCKTWGHPNTLRCMYSSLLGKQYLSSRISFTFALVAHVQGCHRGLSAAHLCHDGLQSPQGEALKLACDQMHATAWPAVQCLCTCHVWPLSSVKMCAWFLFWVRAA